MFICQDVHIYVKYSEHVFTWKESSETSNGNENEKFSKYWTAVKENPSDFTSWTCLLQTVDQEVSNSY